MWTVSEETVEQWCRARGTSWGSTVTLRVGEVAAFAQERVDAATHELEERAESLNSMVSFTENRRREQAALLRECAAVLGNLLASIPHHEGDDNLTEPVAAARALLSKLPAPEQEKKA